MDLVEGDDTVEAVAAPVEQLLQPPRGGEQRVGDEEDALLELDARVRLPARLCGVASRAAVGLGLAL